MKKLTEEEITGNLHGTNGWVYNNNALVKAFTFADFTEAFAFMTSVAVIAEELDHHPDWSNVYNKVNIRLSTHDPGGVTDKDFQFVKLVEEISL